MIYWSCWSSVRSFRLHPIRKLRQFGTKSSVRDFYKVLGLQRNATQRQIKAAYYELSKKYHPDVAGRNADAEAKFIEINEAYECLKDPEKRKVYDNEGCCEHHYADFSRSKEFRHYHGRKPQHSFNSRRFTQQEYERIWKEFNRMRTERESYDESIKRESQKIWEQFFKERDAKWQEFRTKFPEEASRFRYSWSWSSHNPKINRNLLLFIRIVIIYMVCFVVVTLIQLLLSPVFNVGSSRLSKHDFSSKNSIEPKESMQFSYMNHPPSEHTDTWSNVVNSAVHNSGVVDVDLEHDTQSISHRHEDSV